MSISLSFISGHAVSYDEFASIVHELGGYAYPDASSISAGKAIIYCNVVNEFGDYSPEEMQELMEVLEMAPRGLIQVTLGSGAGSANLASTLFQQLERRFGGVIDMSGHVAPIEGRKMVWMKENYE